MSQPQPPIVFIRPTSDIQWRDWQQFRWAMLRAPWLPKQPAELQATTAKDSEYWMAYCTQQAEMVACGQLQQLPQGHAQLRNMAVAPSYRGQGLGRQMLDKLESMARGRGCTLMIAQARNTALNFYQQQGYSVTRAGQTLFGEIAHSWVEKPLQCDDFSYFDLQRRAVRNSDNAALSAFIFAVLSQYGLAPELDGIDQDLQAPQQIYQAGFFDLLLDQNGKIQGSVGLLPVSAQEAELRRMYLSPAQRGRGLGRACLGHALARARALGFRRISLETASVLQEALGLYRWAGFIPEPGPMHARRCDQRLVLTLD